MSFFSKFFKAKEPESIEDRIAALKDYGQPELVDCAMSEESEPLRVAAVQKLAFCPQLCSLASKESTPSSVATAAKKRIGELLDDGSVTIDALAQNISDQRTLLQVCGYSSTATLQLVGTIQSTELLADIAKHGATNQLRQAAVERIEDKEAIEDVYKHAKGKDKSVYKIAKAKLDIYKQERAKQAQIDTELVSLCNQAEQLNKRHVDDVFYARLEQIKSSWQKFAEQAGFETSARFQQIMDRCHTKIEEIKQAEQLKQAAKEAELSAKKELLEAMEKVQSLVAGLFNHHKPSELKDEIESALNDQEKALKEATEKGLNTQKESQIAAKLRQTQANLLAKLEQHGTLPQLIERLKDATTDSGEKVHKQVDEILQHAKEFKDDTLPEIIATSRQTLSDWRKSVKEKLAARSEKLKNSAELVRKGNWAVSKGHVGRARAILRDLKADLEQMEDVPNHLQGKLEELETAINKLGDWHSFAVTPKKQSLVQEMESLISSDLPPQDLADKVQVLQNQWKELCRGGQNQDEDLWNAFHNASQQAYEPCKKYFEEQTQLREDNAAKRHTLIQQLNEYLRAYDWENAVWPDVEKTLKVSREAWQSYWPIPRKETKVLQGQFDGVMDALHAKLNGEFEKNRTKKQLIVDQAAKLLESQDTNAAIEGAKNLQQQWRGIGRCKRKDDQQLWNQFRAHCDKVFEKRQQENDSQREERNQNRDRAIQLLEQLESIPKLQGEAFYEAKSQLDSIISEYQELGELPRDESKAIGARYQSALKAIEQATDQLRSAANIENWSNIFAFAEQLTQVENSAADSTSVDALESAVHDHHKWPGETQKALELRIQLLREEAEVFPEEAEAALRLICVKAEVAKGIESPAADKDLRMQYQVQQLKESFGQSSGIEEQLMGLVEEWLAVRGAPITAYHSHFERFSATLDWLKTDQQVSK